MNELNPESGTTVGGRNASGGSGAGQMLREAREAQGISIEALAAMMKVTVHKLELLETGRHDELPDATFARALAQSMCRTLKIDPAPVLEQLPRVSGSRIEHVSEGLNEPFRDHPSRLDAFAWMAGLRSMWAPALLLLVAGAIYFIPLGFLRSTVSSVGGMVDAVRSGAGSAGVETVMMPTTEIVVQDGVATITDADPARPTTTTRVPPTAGLNAPTAAPLAVAPAVVDPPPPRAVGAATVELRASAESWVEVRDGRNRILISRALQPGETVMLDGAMPMRVKIGNAAVTELRYRGELIDLTPMTSENIARVQLK